MRAAGYAKEHGSTLARAALVVGTTRKEAARAWSELYPDEIRTEVP